MSNSNNSSTNSSLNSGSDHPSTSTTDKNGNEKNSKILYQEGRNNLK
jgi:hypothetical protein